MSCGQLASLLMKITLHYTANRSSRWSIRGHSIIGVSVAFLVLGTFFAWIWIPEVQSLRILENDKSRLMDKKLEDLAEGIMIAQRDGQVIGLRSHLYSFLGLKLRFLFRSFFRSNTE
jgi:hypothetical protein